MPLTILVADDELGTRVAVTDYLALQGYDAIAAKDGQDALLKVKQHRPHLIVTDIAMPRMDGHEFVRQVRSQPNLRLLPVVFLTERGETADRIAGYQIGGDAYLAKPFELAELLAVVRNLLDRAQNVAMEVQYARQSLMTTSMVPTSMASNRVVSGNDEPILSQREQEVLNLLSGGDSNSQIGEKLHLSPRTIEKHVSSLLRKTEAHNRAELVRYALEHELVK